MNTSIAFFAALLMTANVLAQAPEKMSYQAVVRDAAGDLVTSTDVGVQISILQGSESGTAVYVETHVSATNTNGLLTLELGDGAGVSGNFSAITWTNGPYYIQSEMDLSGGTSYTVTGISQLVSVPYALHAKTAESLAGAASETDPIFGASVAAGITASDTIFWNSKQDPLTAGPGISIVGSTISAAAVGVQSSFYLGQDTLGGVVFYMYHDHLGVPHGLIVSKTETAAAWQTMTNTTGANQSWDGAFNMALMTNSPAKTWVSELGSEWYLPSIDELSLLWHNRFHANKGLNDADATLLSNSVSYWSSTEFGSTYAFLFVFMYGNTNLDLKGASFNVRAVRSF